MSEYACIVCIPVVTAEENVLGSRCPHLPNMFRGVVIVNDREIVLLELGVFFSGPLGLLSQ